MMAPSFRLTQILQLLSTLVTVYAVVWSGAPAWWWLVALLSYFLTGCLGLSVTLHRSLSHRAFKLSRPLEVLFTWFGLAGGTGSSIGWAALHRAHHAHVDGARDPHSPGRFGVWLVFSAYQYDFDPRHAKDLLRDPVHLLFHRYYTVLIVAWVAGLALLNPLLAVFCFFVPVFAQITVSNLANLLSHGHGYRNFETRDKSTNNALIAVLGWGEGWHNNHHASPRAWSFGRKWWELDIGGMIVAVLMKAGLASEPAAISSTVGETTTTGRGTLKSNAR
jgi:stearoyl-CoA desaturase (delta-9 desaturase)